MEIKCPGCGGPLTYTEDYRGEKEYVINIDGKSADLIDDGMDMITEIYCPNVECWEELTIEFYDNILKQIGNTIILSEKLVLNGENKMDKLSSVEALDLAIKIAATNHHHQIDKSGQPYILHPISVMMKMVTTEEKIVAILHDVIEDTTVTLSDLRRSGFSDTIVDAVDAITKRVNESNSTYDFRVMNNRIATKVKLADVEHNMSLCRIFTLTQRDLDRVQMYHKKWLMLRERMVNYFDAYGTSEPEIRPERRDV